MHKKHLLYQQLEMKGEENTIGQTRGPPCETQSGRGQSGYGEQDWSEPGWSDRE